MLQVYLKIYYVLIDLLFLFYKVRDRCGYNLPWFKREMALIAIYIFFSELFVEV